MLPKISELEFENIIEEQEDLPQSGKSFLFDAVKGDFVTRDGKMIEIEGKEALKQWIEMTIRTAKDRFEVYDGTGYGVRIDDLIGSNYPLDFVAKEIENELNEALLQNELINSLTNFNAEKDDTKLTVKFTVNSIYDDPIEQEVSFLNRDQIHTEILGHISDKFDKRVGSFIYLVTRPVAIVLEKVYEKNNEVKEKLDIDNLTGDELEQRVKDRTGIDRRLATHARGILTAIGNGTINEGDLFETKSGIQFEATETVSIVDSGIVQIRAIIAGNTGIVPANQITHMPVTLDNIDSVTNPEPTYDGFDAETDESLLERYYERRRTPATSGNIYHYLNWAKNISGVGDARVFPLHYGDNTVRVVIIDSNKQPASTELINQVQDYIDPNSSGLGEGEAPIGAFCTVESAVGVDINISFNVTLSDGYDEQDVIDNVSVSIKDYLKEIAFVQDYMSYAQIGSIIINTDGVADYTNLTVNGNTNNITIADDEVAILGGVSID